MENKYSYEVAQDNSGEPIIIQRAEGTDAAATWSVTSTGLECSPNPSDTDTNPIEADGCWPEPPASVVSEARRLLDVLPNDVADTFRTWCAEQDRDWSSVEREIHEIDTNVFPIGEATKRRLEKIWQETEARS